MLPSASFLQLFIKVDLQAYEGWEMVQWRHLYIESTFETSVHRLTVYGNLTGHSGRRDRPWQSYYVYLVYIPLNSPFSKKGHVSWRTHQNLR